jgi:hypothetical protein
MRWLVEFGIVSRFGKVSRFGIMGIVGIVSRRGIVSLRGIVDIVSRLDIVSRGAIVSSGGLVGVTPLEVSTGVVVVSCFGTAIGFVTACDGVIGVALFRSTLPRVVSVVDPLIPPALMLPPEPDLAMESVGSGIPFPNPMFIAASIDLASVAPEYLLSHFLTAARVAASILPETWLTPQPSSRSCCCSATVSTRVSPCANAGAAQHTATAQAPSKLYFMLASRGVCHAPSCAISPQSANDGPKSYLSTAWAMRAPRARSTAAAAIITAGLILIERLYQG